MKEETETTKNTTTQRRRRSTKPKTATETKTKAETKTATEQPKNIRITPKTWEPVDQEQYVIVRNGFQGRLVYKSKRTGERFVWDHFGAEQEMQLRELKNAKNSNKKFFENNWFMFDEDWIVDYLGVGGFYKDAIRIEDFDSIFKKDAEEVRRILSAMSKGQRRSAAYRAMTLVSEGKIDSISTITAIEESLGVELIER